ncbi:MULTISPECIES: type VII secretion system-associated protein [unclassified Streptomyces]|uniref:type VII secretion system-associated protein n=1 Tax=unclassified Streptomyces TaxID=2593676 RepID=UPI0036F0EB81
MPGSDHPHLEQLDFSALQNFTDTDVNGFLAAIDEIRSPTASPVSLYEVRNRNQVLGIGPLAGDSETGGKDICDRAKSVAGEIDDIFNHHKDALTKLQAELHNVIKDMKKAQEQNLTQVESQKFMTAVTGYQSALGGGTSGSTGNVQNSPSL